MKRKKQHTKPKVSPVKYIQTRSRTLPIHECWVNESWDSIQIAKVIVSRKHTNGNISLAGFLVDLLCMGVKDTHYLFNVPQFEYIEFLNNMKEEEEEEFIQIDYHLAHNIVFAGYEFAQEIGLEPCKEFSTITKCFLEEDNDDIDLIDIDCGKDGVPCIYKGRYHKQEADKVYQLLCKTIGRDNFIFEDLDIEEQNWELNDDRDDWDEELEDQLDALWFDEPIDFEELLYANPLKERHKDVQRLNEMHAAKKEDKDFYDVLNRLYYNHFGYEEIDASRERLFNFFDLEIKYDPIPDDVLGFDAEKHPDKLKIVEQINEKIQTEDIDLLKTLNQYPDIPFFKYLFIMQLEFMEINQEEEFKEEKNLGKHIEKVLDGFIIEHPDYFLFKVMKERYHLQKNKKSCFIEKQFYADEPISDFFGRRSYLHTTEFINLVKALFEAMVNKEDILGVDSLVHFIQSEYPEMGGGGLTPLLMANMMLKSQLCHTIYVHD